MHHHIGNKLAITNIKVENYNYKGAKVENYNYKGGKLQL
jgi:hypothetical protein